MKNIKTMRQLIQFGIELHETHDLPDGFVVCVRVDAKDREKMFGQMLDWNIDHEYMLVEDKKKGFYSFNIFDIQFHLF